MWTVLEAIIVAYRISNIKLAMELVDGQLFLSLVIHSKLGTITLVATKVHMILQSFVVLTWMHDTI